MKSETKQRIANQMLNALLKDYIVEADITGAPTERIIEVMIQYSELVDKLRTESTIRTVKREINKVLSEIKSEI